jgi:hypothetical protein
MRAAWFCASSLASSSTPSSKGGDEFGSFMIEDLGAFPAAPLSAGVVPPAQSDAIAALVREYTHTKAAFFSGEPKPVFGQMNPAAIYATNELRMADVDVFGFDYDYTLADCALLRFSCRSRKCSFPPHTPQTRRSSASPSTGAHRTFS